jgi:hypothetical protein
MEKPKLIQLRQTARLLKIHSDEISALLASEEVNADAVARKARLAAFTAKDIDSTCSATPDLLGMLTEMNPALCPPSA